MSVTFLTKAAERLKRAIRYLIGLIVILALAWFVYFIVYGNVHRVDKDYYRSAQLFSHNLAYDIRRYGIRSIINLRGEKPTKSWYRNEMQTAHELNVTHYDFRLPSRSFVKPQRLRKLVALIRQAPKPVLVHCKAGADRTSLATALYLYALRCDRDAKRAFSLLYGHFPYLESKTEAMDRSFDAYTKEYGACE